MESNYKELLFRIADTTLILGQRLAEWCGHGPILEEDIALTNISLDLIGQSRLIYSHMGEQEGKSEDDYAFLRDANEFRNLLLVEQENGDFAQTIARQYLYSTYYALYLEGLCESKDEFLREFAARSIKEVRYHVKHCRQWLFRLGDGTAESHKRMQQAVNELWPYSGECFMDDAIDQEMAEQGIAPALASLKSTWENQVAADMEIATMSIPEKVWMHKGSREGIHTERLGFILSEMQWLQRAYPGAEW